MSSATGPVTNGTSNHGDEQAVSQDEVQSAINTYTHMIEKRMTPMLDAAVQRRDAAFAELMELEQTEVALRALELTVAERGATVEGTPVVETHVNIGEEFYVCGHVYDCDTLVVDVGCDVFVEMSPSEASAFFQKRRALWQARADTESKTVSEVRAQLEEMASTLSQLQ